MLVYEIELSKQAAKFIEKQTPKLKKRIAQAFVKLQENPYRYDLDIRKLRHFENDYRLRIGKFRFLYTIF